MVRIVLVACLIPFFVGCTKFNPRVIHDPKPYEGDSTTKRTTPQSPQYKDATGLTVPTTLKQASDDTLVYSMHYQQVADGFSGDSFYTDEAQFYGAIIGGVGGIVESTAAAITGVVTASGASLYSEHYQIALQTANYRRASEAFHCMHTEIENAAPFMPEAANHDVPSLVHQIKKLRKKLKTAQASVELMVPDAERLLEIQNKLDEKKKDTEKEQDASVQSALKDYATAKQAAGGVNIMAVLNNTNKAVTLSPATVQLRTEAQRAKMKELNTSIDKCIEEF